LSIFPVGLNVEGQPCLVVGGGRVAARKIAGLLACRAAVTVVAPEAHEAVRLLAAEGVIAAVDGAPLNLQIRPYERGEAARYRLVFTATGHPDVDAAVYEDAHRAGVWVNSADDAGHCTVLLPAVLRDGPVTVSVSTSGTSPALAVWLRDRLADLLGGGLGELAQLMADARERVKERTGTTEGVDWNALLEGPLPSLVAGGRIEEARTLLDEAVARARPTV